MSLKDLLKSRLIESFKIKKANGAHDLALRPGYFFIEEINYEDIPKKGKIPFAKALWKAKSEDLFIKDVHFKIALSSLKLDSPLNYVTLPNKVIEVFNVEIIKNVDDKPQLACEYSISDQKPAFVTLQDLVLSAFMGNPTSTLFEAYQKFEDELGINLSESLEEEARGQDLIEDSLDDFPCEDTNLQSAQ